MASRIATTLPYTELEVATGNYDQTRSPIDRIIIHTMVGTAQGAAARFDNPASQVSAHYGVKLDGTLIHWLEETFTAYHAGNYVMNQRSIGIEHEDNWNGQPPEPTRTDQLYAMSARLVKDIATFYDIPLDRNHILKHNEVSDKPTGCPDALDIDRIIREAKGETPDVMAVITQKELDQIRQDRDQHYNDLQQALKANNVLNSKIEQQGLIIAKDARDDVDLGTKNMDLSHQLDEITQLLGLPTATTHQQVVEVIKGLQKPHKELVKQVVPLINNLADAAIYKRPPTIKGYLSKIKDWFSQFTKGVSNNG